MKVVLFCGGYGMRMRNGTADDVPKPMAMVGPRPLIWHVMRYYAHYGHKEFILCLGYRGASTIVLRLAQECASTAMVVCMHYCGVAVLEAVGPESVRKDAASGAHLSTLAFSETGSRSHFWAPVGTARRDGSHVVHGRQGVTLAFGVMKIVNVTHGSFYALGAYTVGWFASDQFSNRTVHFGTTAVEDLPRYLQDGYLMVSAPMTAKLDQLIRELESRNISFKGWATPGANPSAAALDLARTICRRAERRVCALKEADQLQNLEIIVYLNRLADLLWLFARWAEANADPS